jgi:hypothetical protein
MCTAEETFAMNREVITMGCTQGELDARFLACVNAFNAYDPTIGGYLDASVKIRTVRSKTTVTGKPNVQNYFQDQYKQNPHFEPNVGNASYHSKVQLVQGILQGTVRGVGTWIDDEERQNQRPAFGLPYEFGFVCTGDSWLLSEGRSL